MVSFDQPCSKIVSRKFFLRAAGPPDNSSSASCTPTDGPPDQGSSASCTPTAGPSDQGSSASSLLQKIPAPVAVPFLQQIPAPVAVPYIKSLLPSLFRSATFSEERRGDFTHPAS